METWKFRRTWLDNTVCLDMQIFVINGAPLSS
jgi:hypothetical protein